MCSFAVCCAVGARDGALGCLMRRSDLVAFRSKEEVVLLSLIGLSCLPPSGSTTNFVDLRYLEHNTIDIFYWYTKLDFSGGLINLPEKNGQNLFATKATRRTTGGLQRFHMVTAQ